jgi:hypothetical protein
MGRTHKVIPVEANATIRRKWLDGQGDFLAGMKTNPSAAYLVIYRALVQVHKQPS